LNIEIWRRRLQHAVPRQAAPRPHVQWRGRGSGRELQHAIIGKRGNTIAQRKQQLAALQLARIPNVMGRDVVVIEYLSHRGASRFGKQKTYRDVTIPRLLIRPEKRCASAAFDWQDSWPTAAEVRGGVPP
jgi:hypothetical protein